MNPNKPTPRLIIIKMAKIKEISKGSKRKIKSHMRGNPIRLLADFSAETLQARRKWHDIYKALKEKNLQLRILYPERL